MDILIKPIITEKANWASEVQGCYTFEVHPKANKIEIKSAIEEAYGVNVAKVRTAIQGPERKTKFTKTGVQKGKTKVRKKAYVNLVDGDAIDIYANM